jgi:DNA-binding transcriptional LysR family regulator
MSRPMDLNLLLALDALLDEESVTAAADRLGLSAPAMSRTLTRIRTAFGDPILVRSGRTMVATPRAQAIHAEVKALLDRSRALFAEGRPVDEAQLHQVFTVLASDYFPVHLATRLLPRLQSYAPGVSVAFSPEGQHLGQPLRDGTADLELGVISAPNPETRVEPLYTDHMLVVVRRGHPLTEAPLTPAALARALHITTSRRGRLTGPLDEALAARGLRPSPRRCCWSRPRTWWRWAPPRTAPTWRPRSGWPRSPFRSRCRPWRSPSAGIPATTTTRRSSGSVSRCAPS